MTANTPKSNDRSNSISADEVKRQASGRWLEILRAAGLAAELLDGRGHPCPKCGGTDRFTVFGDIDVSGGVMCRQCFDEKNGDGLAAVQWLRESTFPEAVAFVAGHLGMQPRTDDRPIDIVTSVASAKRMPLEAFRQFGAEPAKRGKAIVARVPVYDEHGEIHSYFDMTPDEKGWFKRGKGMSGLFLPGRLPQPGEEWLLVEGVKDAAALVGLGFHAAGLPTCEMHAKYSGLFRGCEIVGVPDLDSAGADGAQRTAGRLAGIAASVRIARLPGEIVRSGGDDVRDVIKTAGADAVRNAIEDAEAWQPSDGEPEDGRPGVLITLDESVVAGDVLRQLGNLGWSSSGAHSPATEQVRLYQRGGVLVQIICDQESQASGVTLPEAVPQIRAVPKALIRERITQAVRLVSEEKRQDETVLVPKRPPEWLVQAIHQRGDFGAVRRLAGITRTPTIRPDGTVLQSRGYDAKTGLVLLPDREFPTVPAKPTRDDAIKAMQELVDVLADFPFASDAHRSIWLATVLTLLARPAIDGPCPFFAFDANTRGAGKSLLADVAGIIASGSGMARKSWPKGDEEVRKTITSIVIEGWPAVLFDNVASTLGGEAIDAALTGTTWQDRILGESRTTGTLPLSTVWLATGNNIDLSADTARRVLMARLESPEEHPEDRTGFRHGDLKAYVRNERARLAIAGLTVLRAYFVADCPDMKIPPWGSFEAWSRLIRHAIVWTGFADPWLTRKSMRDADRSYELVRLIHAGIEEADGDGNGLTTADMVRLLTHPVGQDDVDPWPILRTAVSELCTKVDSKRIGYGLRKYRGRVCAGKRLECRDGHGGVKRWFIESIETLSGSDGGDGCDGGDEFGHGEVEAEVVTYEL